MAVPLQKEKGMRAVQRTAGTYAEMMICLKIDMTAKIRLMHCALTLEFAEFMVNYSMSDGIETRKKQKV